MSVLPGEYNSVTFQRDDDSPLLKYANEKRLDDYFNDTIVEVGNQRVPVNRMVLACYSGYFEEKYLIKAEYHQSVRITDMDEESVIKLIEFIYTKEIDINNENVMSLLFTSNKLKIKDAKDFCFVYLEISLLTDNCFFILNVANQYKEESMKAGLYEFICNNFNDLVQDIGFKNITKPDLISCISELERDEISEMQIYDEIIKWTKHDEQNRKLDFPDLFQLLNLDQFSNYFLLHVVAEEILVKENPVCYRIVMERLTPLTKEIRKENESKILSLGGVNTPLKVSEVYRLPGLSVPKNYPDLPMKLSSHSSLIFEDKVICIGGQNEEKDVTNKVWQMDLYKAPLKWQQMIGMNDERDVMDATTFNDTIIVAGGYNGNSQIASSEIYIKDLEEWKNISALQQARSGNALVACDGCLFAVGGYHYKGRYLSSVERLRGLKDNWEFVKSMNTPRRWLAAVCVKNYLYAIGGEPCLAEKCLKSVERYDPTSNTWSFVKDMNFARSSHAACVLQDKIFVVGGIGDSFKVVKEIECYDPVLNIWTVVGKTPNELFHHSLVVL